MMEHVMKNLCATGCLLLVCATQVLYAQTPEIGIRRSGPPPDPPAISSQEQPGVQEQLDAARLQAVPSEMRSIRQRQLEVAKEQQVYADLHFKDNGRVSTTVMRGVPADLGDITITSEDQVIALADTLYPLFGFSGTERLIYSGKVGNTYKFIEHINGLPAELMTINIAVRPDQKISSVQGTTVLNQDFGRDHFLDEQGAIDAVNRHLEAEGMASPSRLNFDFNAYLIYKHWDDYRTLAPWWFVEHARGSLWYVDPNGVVSSAVTITP
jgi:hypothetical protein